MNKVKMFLSAAALTAAMGLMGAGGAQAATCAMGGHVYAVITNPTYCVIWVHNYAAAELPTVAHSFCSNSAKVCAAAEAAKTSGQTVYATGSVAAATCPTANYSSYGDYASAGNTAIATYHHY